MITNISEKYILSKEVCYRVRHKALKNLRGSLEEYYTRLRSYIVKLNRVILQVKD